jgi:hypothetical protein
MHERSRRGRRGEVAAQQAFPVAQHAVVEERRRIVEDDGVEPIEAQPGHQIGEERGGISERSRRQALAVDVDRDVEVAPGAGIAPRLRAE